MDTWDLYFASLCGWMLHPGYQREGAESPTLRQCAELADSMEEIKNGRMDRGSGSSR